MLKNQNKIQISSRKTKQTNKQQQKKKTVLICGENDRTAVSVENEATQKPVK